MESASSNTIKSPPLVLPGQCELVITGTPNNVPPITLIPGNAGRSAVAGVSLFVGAGSKAHLLTSLNSEEEGGGHRKSEAPIPSDDLW
jgi:hypothetical protein